MPRLLVLMTHPVGAAVVDRPADAIGGLVPVLRQVPCPASRVGGFFDARLEDLALFEAGRHAAEEGYDAVCTMTLDDGAAGALRSVLDLPVLAAGRTTSLHALTLADRFGWIVESQGHEARLRTALRQWQLADRCTGIRVAPSDQPHAVRAALAACIEIDSAAAVCLGSPALATSTRDAWPKPGDVPLLDPLAVTACMTEALLALNLSHSRTAAPRPLVPKPAVVQAMAKALAAPPHDAPAR